MEIFNSLLGCRFCKLSYGLTKIKAFGKIYGFAKMEHFLKIAGNWLKE